MKNIHFVSATRVLVIIALLLSSVSIQMQGSVAGSSSVKMEKDDLRLKSSRNLNVYTNANGASGLYSWTGKIKTYDGRHAAGVYLLYPESNVSLLMSTVKESVTDYAYLLHDEYDFWGILEESSNRGLKVKFASWREDTDSLDFYQDYSQLIQYRSKHNRPVIKAVNGKLYEVMDDELLYHMKNHRVHHDWFDGWFWTNDHHMFGLLDENNMIIEITDIDDNNLVHQDRRGLWVQIDKETMEQDDNTATKKMFVWEDAGLDMNNLHKWHWYYVDKSEYDRSDKGLNAAIDNYSGDCVVLECNKDSVDYYIMFDPGSMENEVIITGEIDAVSGNLPLPQKEYYHDLSDLEE